MVKAYHQLMLERIDEVRLLSLEDMNLLERTRELIAAEEDFLIPSEKFVFVMPEYNGSFPGVLKLMIDNSDIKKCWWYKKAMLVGVADGRAGNLRGMEHMTNILHYLKMNVLYNKVPISRVNEEISPEGNVLKPETAQVIADQIDEFIKF